MHSSLGGTENPLLAEKFHENDFLRDSLSRETRKVMIRATKHRESGFIFNCWRGCFSIFRKMATTSSIAPRPLAFVWFIHARRDSVPITKRVSRLMRTRQWSKVARSCSFPPKERRKSDESAKNSDARYFNKIKEKYSTKKYFHVTYVMRTAV